MTGKHVPFLRAASAAIPTAMLLAAHAAPVAANPTYAQAGIIGRFFRVGMSYKF